MEDSIQVNVSGFDLRSYCNTARRRQIATTSSVVVSTTGPYIGFSDCNRVNIDILEINLGMKDAKAVWRCLSCKRKGKLPIACHPRMSFGYGASSKLPPLRHRRSEIIDPLDFSSVVQRCDRRKATDLD
ncbi:hypothetical protein TNCV_801991 [Trichonephila clavipes]|nr:hypothetical protein TNCV_801991 [Trichonephila clavipes]